MLDRVEAGIRQGLSRRNQFACGIGVGLEFLLGEEEEPAHDLFLRVVGRSGQGPAVGIFKARLVVHTTLPEDACGEDAGGFDEAGVIQQGHGRDGCVGAGALSGTFFPGGGIECP